MKRNIAVTLSEARMEAFCKQCGNVISVYEPENDHESLLFEHLVELHEMLEKKLRNEQKNYRITLTGSQALAFYQLFQTVNLAHDPYSKVIVDETIGLIDRQHKSPARKYRYAAHKK